MAAAARQAGYAEPIRLVTDERHLPYHRPPLSKGFLLGEAPVESMGLRAEAFYQKNAIDVVMNTWVERIDLKNSAIETTGGRIPFDKLGLATGTRARPLPIPGADLDGIVTLRSLADAEAIQARLSEVGSVVIIGGGYIGLELAATFTKLDKQVTVLEGLERSMARVTVPAMSRFVEAQHLANGVTLVFSARVTALEGDKGQVRAVLTADGARYPADLVVLAVGAVPNTELLEEIGLADRNGVEVDEFGRTRDPRIFAAGDCALHFNPFAGEMIRLESVQNATDQAKAAGAAIAGVEQRYHAVPWFWSDQFDLKLQMVGLSKGADQEVVRGSIEDRKFSLFYFKNGVLIGIDSVNAPADHMLGRRLLAKPPLLTPAQAADMSLDLKSLLA
jgi:3-phenylpropionate/trans-cinnamate dioxygenase ferredoxin reductase subunit